MEQKFGKSLFNSDEISILNKNPELDATIKNIIEDHLLDIADIKKLIHLIGKDTTFQQYFNDQILAYLKHYNILNNSNVDSFFSVFYHTSFLSSSYYTLHYKQVLTSNAIAQENYSRLCTLAQRFEKMRQDALVIENTEDRQKALEKLEVYKEQTMDLLTFISEIADISAHKFQQMFLAILHFACDPWVVKQIHERLTEKASSMSEQGFWGVIESINKIIEKIDLSFRDEYQQLMDSKKFKNTAELKLSSLIIDFVAPTFFKSAGDRKNASPKEPEDKESCRNVTPFPL
ncbi:MAG TPA: hypothetical protein VHE99_09590 [Gammaproteobacteria bacterium]|nr:hypothetical protein [Gammaproteobacteria bacterium]